jgi:TP901 family phage tail tape measure protein
MSLLGNTAELAILLKLKDEFSGPLKSADSQLQGLHSRVGQIGTGVATMGKGLAVAAERIAAIGITAGVAVGGIAISATKSAASFQTAMELIHTQAGASQQEVNDLSKAVLALAPTVGTGPDALATGLYHIESAGLRGAKAMEILKVAAEGAAVGGADLESVTNALIAATNSGIKGTTDMAGSMGVLNAIVGSGNMRMGDLTAAFTTGILSSAKAFGVSIQSVGASIADMTNQGVPAIDAATRLRMTISLLGAPTSKAATELKSIGLGSMDLATAMRGPDGILGAVQMLKDHLDASGLSATKQTALLSAAFGGGRSSSAILTLLGSLKQFNTIQDQVNAGAGKFGDAWASKSAEVDQKVQNVRASLDTLKITLGERLLPVAGSILDEVSKVLGSPAAISAADQMGQAIAGIFSQDNISKAEQFVGQVAIFAHNILPPLIDGLKIAGQITSTAVSAFTSLPAPLQAMIIGGLAVNKLSGGLVATGLKQVAQGLLPGGGGGGGGLVGGMLGVQKVYVVGVAPGVGFGPGGGGGAGSALGTTGMWATVGKVIGGAFAIVAVAELADALYPMISAGGGYQNRVTTGNQLPADQLSWPWGPKNTPHLDIGPFKDILGGDSSFTVPAIPAAVTPGSKITTPTNLTGAGMSADRRAALAGQDFGAAGLTAVNELSGGLTAQLKGGRVGETAAGLASSITGVFSHSLSPSLVSMTSALNQEKAIQAKYLAQGDTKLAASIAANIKYLAGRVDVVAAVIRSKQFTVEQITTANTIYRQGERGDVSPRLGPPVPVNLHVTVTTSARQNTHAATIANRYGPTLDRAGGW